jgi:hypothetical protein
LAAIAILGLYLGWEIHAWRTWRLRLSFLRQAAEAASWESTNRSFLHPKRVSLARLNQTDPSQLTDLARPDLGFYRSRSARLAEWLADKDRLERETRYLAAAIEAYAQRKHKYKRAAANPWGTVAPDPPLPKRERDADSWLVARDYGRALAAYDEMAQASPDLVGARLTSAWLRATCADPRFRDGKLAVASAARACELTRWKDVGALGVLAAACAEVGDFAAAVKWQQQAVELMTHLPREQFYRDRLALYKAGKPYRQQ